MGDDDEFIRYLASYLMQWLIEPELYTKDITQEKIETILKEFEESFP